MNQAIEEHKVDEAISQLIAAASKQGYQPMSVWTGTRYITLKERGAMETIDIVAACPKPTVVFQNTEKELVEFGLDTRPGMKIMRGCSSYGGEGEIWDDMKGY